MARPVSILHLHSPYDLEGEGARAARLMNAWGDRARHVIASDSPSASEAIGKGVACEIAQAPPPLAGKPSVARYEAIARFMRGFDLVLTYGWGAIDGAMARRAFAKGAPPLVHHEDGFDDEEANGLKIERNVYRRIALPAAHALAVPSEAMEAIALKAWRQPRERVHRIAGGVATKLYGGRPDPKALPGFRREPGEVVIGAVGPLRAAKDFPALVRAAGGLSGKFRLVIVGEGPERARIEGAAQAMGIADRLTMAGARPHADHYLGLFDMLAVSSRSEQFPIVVIEAMAAGLPIASLPVGDVKRMVSAENAPFVADFRTEVKLRDVMQALIDHPDVRAQVGAANRARTAAEYDEAAMIARYATLYEQAMARPGALG